MSNQLELWDLNTKQEQPKKKEKKNILNGLLDHLILNRSCLSAAIILVYIYDIAVYNKVELIFRFRQERLSSTILMFPVH